MKLLWIHGLSCSGNTQSFLCAENPSPGEILSRFEVIYHPAITWERYEEEAIKELLESDEPLGVLILEGAVGAGMRKLLGRDFKAVLRELAHKSEYVIALGNCAVFGNIPARYSSQVKGLQYRFGEKGGLLGEDFRSLRGLPVINLSGCPAHPSWLTHVLIEILEGRDIPLDSKGRPVEIYAYLTHQGCPRNEYFEWKVEAKEFGRREGCLFYHFGCRGPMTHAPCNRILWNGVSSKTRAGMPCVGCTEFDFPRENMLKTKQIMGIPEELPLGVSKRGYILMAGIAKSFTPERLKKRLFYEGD